MNPVSFRPYPPSSFEKLIKPLSSTSIETGRDVVSISNSPSSNFQSAKIQFGTNTLSPGDQQWIDDLKAEYMAEAEQWGMMSYFNENINILPEELQFLKKDASYKASKKVDIKLIQRLEKLAQQHPENNDLQLLYQNKIVDYTSGEFSKEYGQSRFESSKLRERAVKALQKEFPISEFLVQRHQKSHIKLLEDRKKELNRIGLPHIDSLSSGFDVDSLRSLRLPELLIQTNGLYKNFKQMILHFRRPRLESSKNDLDVLISTFDGDEQSGGLQLGFSQVSEPFSVTTLSKGFTATLNPKKQIFYDTTPKTGRLVRAGCYLIGDSRKVILNLPPEKDRLRGFLSSLHEIGHAFHFIFTQPEFLFSNRFRSNDAITETYAFLFDNLSQNRHWLIHKAGLTGEEATNQMKHSTLMKFDTFRRYVCNSIFQLSLIDPVNTASLDEKLKHFEERLKNVEWGTDLEKWNLKFDGWNQSLGYVMAYTLSAKLEENIKARFGTPEHDGDDWYLNPKAGEYLKEMWGKGSPPVEEFAKELGLSHALDSTALVKLFEERLK